MAHRFSYIGIALLYLLLLTGCGSDPASPSDKPPASSRTFDVVWQDNVVYFDSTMLGNILSLDTAQYLYHFQKTSPLAASLQQGDIIVVHGQTIRRVVKVTTSGNEVIVETEEAYLTDAIKSGKIGWSYTPVFDSAITPLLIVDGIEHPMAKSTYPNGGFTHKFELGNYSYEITMNFIEDKADVSCKIHEKSGIGVGTTFNIKGTIEQLTSQSEMTFANGTISNVDYKNKNVAGKLTVGMEVKKSSDLGVKVPVTLLKFPFLIGPIPASLNVRLEWAVTSQIPLGGHANVSSTFTFDSETGFRYDGSQLHAEGIAGQWSATTDTVSSGAVGALSAEFSAGFPQIEVDILSKSFVSYARPTFLIRGDYSISGLNGASCQRAKAVFAGVVGVKLSALGLVSLTEKQLQLWIAEKELLKQGQCE